MKKLLTFLLINIILFLFCNSAFNQIINNYNQKYYIKFLLTNDCNIHSLNNKIQSLKFISEFNLDEENSYIIFDKEYTSKQVLDLLEKSNIKYDKTEFESKNHVTLKLSDNYFFPQYINTGNEKLDEENYEIAKNNWINNHPKEFEKIKHLDLDKLSGKE